MTRPPTRFVFRQNTRSISMWAGKENLHFDISKPRHGLSSFCRLLRKTCKSLRFNARENGQNLLEKLQKCMRKEAHFYRVRETQFVTFEMTNIHSNLGHAIQDRLSSDSRPCRFANKLNCHTP